MDHKYTCKLSRLIVPAVLFSFAISNIADAAPAGSTIGATSIKWDDAENRMKLLASVPSWDESAMKTMFDVYRDAAHNQLPTTANEKTYNVEFIHGMWGPLANPFTKYPRPAKVFVSINHSSAFYMAPLIKDATDGNYYVFQKNQPRPVLLADWVQQLATANGGLSGLNFNICNGYGDALNDVCMKAYQSEVEDATDNGSQARKRNVLAVANHVSAQRDINQDWRVKAGAPRVMNRSLATEDSILNSSIEWKNATEKNKLLNLANSWPNFKTIQANFEKIRDIRYFNDKRVPGFMRRISWLYPDDGCFTRASAVIKDLFGPIHNAANQYPRPSKIFAFGNLCVNSDNSQRGYVSWWYHTAPVVKDAETGQVYVLDPAVEPRKPLPVEKWMAAISSNTGNCQSRQNSVDKFYICNGYGTVPYSKCGSDYREEENQDIAQPEFQNAERSRQTQLGRDANAVLGDAPPWLN